MLQSIGLVIQSYDNLAGTQSEDSPKAEDLRKTTANTNSSATTNNIMQSASASLASTSNL